MTITAAPAPRAGASSARRAGGAVIADRGETWRVLARQAGFETHLQHASGADLELVAPETWQLCYGGRYKEYPATRFAPTERAEWTLLRWL